jgi:hypothetical protein
MTRAKDKKRRSSEKPKTSIKPSTTTEDLLRDLMIIQLGLAGLTQEDIRSIVGVDNNRVSWIVRHVKKVGKQDGH